MKHSILLAPVFVLLFCYYYSNNSSKISAGDFIFSSFNAQKDDFFSIIILKPLPAKTSIYFTDAEWDGSKFGNDESVMHWQTGDSIIPIATEIHFYSTKKQAKASVGTVDKLLKIARSNEAIFAYTGRKRVPKHFISAVATHKDAYGTLLNTNLKEGTTAITFPQGTYYFELKAKDMDTFKNIRLRNYVYKSINKPISCIQKTIEYQII